MAAAEIPALQRSTGDPEADGDSGLTSAEAAARLRADGPNVIGGQEGRTRLAILVAQLQSPMVLLLIIASLVSFGVGEHVEAVVILAMVALGAALGFIQEARSEAAVTALRARLALRATVVRDGVAVEVPVADLVRGDRIRIGAGGIVPADARLRRANHLYVDESSLTGESAPALKAVAGEAAPGPVPSPIAAAVAAPCAGQAAAEANAGAIYSGTHVVSGSGEAVLTATGGRTVYGAIARRLEERAPETDFQRGIRAFGMLIVRVTLLLVVVVMVFNIVLERPFLEGLLFAIALAVGLTPELLPAIVTLNLTRGARVLAARGVLVRQLPAIQNLGSVTVLCTDKTGTLTRGQLGFLRATGIDGDESIEAGGARALAVLNSHFQAAFRNPLDAAILAGIPLPADLDDWHKLDELPFDFTRRLLSVVVRHGDEPPLLITKGAPEAVLSRAAQVRDAHGAQPIDDPLRERLAAMAADASAQGFRLLAVGSRALGPGDLGPPGQAADADRLERALTFEGLLLFSDQPKPGVDATIAELARQGVGLKVLTGDNELVARHVAREVGLAVEGVLLGDEVAAMTHTALVVRAPRTTIFARVDPDQKLRIIRALRESGAVVGYLGDGINDGPALHVADVGISVDNATDVARQAADIILTEPSLASICTAVVEGRRTFANTLKYIRMGASSNFGNMLSMAAASAFLPFLPMTPGQILLNNLIYDVSQTAIPTDSIDPEMEVAPARWDIAGIQRFMIVFGPLSSIFDFVTFGLLLVLLGSNAAAFHAGWFVESLFTQVTVVLAIRTRRSPFWRSRPSPQLLAMVVGALVVAAAIPLSPLAGVLGFGVLPAGFWLLLAGIVGAYLVLVEVVKRQVMRG